MDTQRYMRNLRNLFAILFAALAAGCAADPGFTAPNVTVSLDPTGVIPPFPTDQDTSLLVPIELTVLADRTIVVADEAGPTLRYLAPGGSLKRVFGRRGEGPTEFRGIAGLAHSPTGNYIAASDPRNRRITFLRSNGGHLSDFRVHAGRIGAVSVDYSGNVHVDQRGPVSGIRRPGAPTVVVLSPSGDYLYAYGRLETVDEARGEHLLNEARFGQTQAGTWMLLPYQGRLRFYSSGSSSPADSIILPPPEGRDPGGSFTQPVEGQANAFAIVRLPVADDLAVHHTGLIFVAGRQTPPGGPMRTDIHIYTAEGVHVVTIPLRQYARRIAIMGDSLYALRDPYGGDEAAIDVYDIRARRH